MSKVSKVSDCCSAPPRAICGPHGTADASTEDYSICPSCGDYCDYVEETDEEEEYPRKDDTDARTSNQIDQDNARVINAGARR